MPSKIVNRSPLFDKPDGWGPGFALATGHGPGVVVGPGPSSPTVFAQSFPTKSLEQFKLVTRASSVDKTEALGSIQINWLDKRDKFISLSKEYFKVTPAERSFEYSLVAPYGAARGILYVVPGGQVDLVRYTEMTLSRLRPFEDFSSYRFLGIKGEDAVFVAAAILFFAILYSFYRKQLFRVGAFLGNWLVRLFPVLAMMLCGAVFVFMEGAYEQAYDSQWHQTTIESIKRWNDPSLDLGSRPLHSFGIQPGINPQLSPTFWIGNLSRANHRIQTQAAFQAMVLFAILVLIAKSAGARLSEASAASLIAVYYFCVPDLSDGAITLNAVLGWIWQESAIAVLLTFFFFARTGYQSPEGISRMWAVTGLAATTLWILLAWPKLIAFFTLAAAALCLGTMIAIDSRKELIQKLQVAGVLIGGLLLLGVHNYVLNLFLYTPQMYFSTLYDHDFKSLFLTNTSLLLSSRSLGGAKILAFFALAILGAYIALRFGNKFARRLVFGGLALELAIHLFSAANALLELVPLTFTYVEQMGLPIIALLAGTGAWGVLQLALQAIAKVLRFVSAERLANLVTLNRRP